VGLFRSPFWKFSQGGPIHPTRAFYGVDEALGLPALYACCRLLAESLASLPIKTYSRANTQHLMDGGRGLAMGSNECRSGRGQAVRYEGPSIFDAPSVNGTLYDWLFTLMTSLVLQGNAWGFITGRDGYGFPTGIEWIPPQDVNVMDDEQQPWNPLRTRIYVYGRLMSRDELFHIKAFSIAGRTEGISPLRAFALTVLSGIEAQRYGTDWYKSGGFPPGTFQNNEIEIDADQSAQIRQSLVDSMRRREPLVYGRDWDYKPVTVPPSEAQFIQAMQMNATQIAAVFGLPPDRVGGTKGDSLTYSTVEQSTLQVIEALRPWLVRLETAFFDLLPANRYVRFDSDALLKTDLKTRTDIYNIQRNMGLRTTDEIRDLEDLEPLPGAAGGETIPLEVMVAMSRSIRGIPKSMMAGLELEMDLAADRLVKLQEKGIAGPNIEPSTPSPEAALGSIVGSQRGAEDGGDVMERAFLAAWQAIQARNGGFTGRSDRGDDHGGGEPEYLGLWIPRESGGGQYSVTAVARAAWPGADYLKVPADYTEHVAGRVRELFDVGIRDMDALVLNEDQYHAAVAAIRHRQPDEIREPALNGNGRSHR
jgi:HK97 family phage portal protein